MMKSCSVMFRGPIIAVAILAFGASDLLVRALVAQAAPASPATDRSANRQRPLMRDFMGLNVHTVQFKPDLYAPVCRRLRDYHPMRWDVDEDPAKPTVFPMAANGVDWGSLYGSW